MGLELARTIQITLLFAALSLLTACDPPQVAPSKGVEPVVAYSAVPSLNVPARTCTHAHFGVCTNLCVHSRTFQSHRRDTAMHTCARFLR